MRAHRSTIVFTNSRRLAERIALNLNELAGEPVARAHHGSIAREQRLLIEEQLKSGSLPAIVATSSLELGIDMGAVDLVIQVESPLSVAQGLQRVGRAGHRIGEPSRGVLFPKYRGDLLETAVVTRLMHEGAIEPTVVPRNPLDVLAQQLVAMSLDRAWPVDELFATVRQAETYAGLSRDAFEATLGMLAGHYPADEFAELKPRVVWDRVAGTVQARRDARTVAITSGGTIPDRGLFPVYLADDGTADGSPGSRARAARTGGRRVGELDEEMVYEARAGEVVLLGASAWRIESIDHHRVLVTPAPGEPGKVPFWKGDGVGRPVELGRALGAFTRETWDVAASGRRGRERAVRALQELHDLDALAAENLVAYLEEEHEVTGALPTDRTIVLQRFRDELGDWRICLLTPFGARVHAPWALAIEARLRESLGLEVQPIWSDDGIVVRLPATEGAYGSTMLDPGDADDAGGAMNGSASPGPVSVAAVAEAAVLIGSEDVEELVTGTVGGSALFASRFRENAARALLLPRRRPGQRTPLWQMRQRASQLLSVASRYGSFPIILETYREVLSDVFDLPALRELLAAVERREVRVVSVETSRASPFASSLLFDYIATYMYEGDAPLLDRRAQALTLDRDLLRELLGAEQLRELLDGEALAELELELQALTEDRAAGSADGVHDLLRRLGDLTADEVAARVRGAESASRRRAAGEWTRGAARGPSRHPHAHRGRGAMGRHRGRRAVSGRRRRLATRRRARALPGPYPRRTDNAPGALGPQPRAVPDRGARDPLEPAASASSSGPSKTSWPGVSSSGVSCALGAWSANGAIRRYSGSSGAARSPGCAARSSRWSRPRWRASCPPGRVSGAAWAASIAWPRSSPSSRAYPCPPACSSATSCRLACAAIAHRCSMSSERQARSSGWEPGVSGATTAGWPCTGPTGWACCCRPGWRRHRAADGPRGRWHRGLAPRRTPVPPCGTRRLIPPRSDGRGARGCPGARAPAAHRAGDARCPLGPRLGRRGQQRHVRAAPRPALAETRRRPPREPGETQGRRPTRAARGCWPLVARRGRGALDDAPGRWQPSRQRPSG